MSKAMQVLAALVLVSATALAASAGDFVEYEQQDGTPTLVFYTSGKVHGKLGWNGFALIQKDWSEAFAGPTFAPAKWVQISVNAGLETGGVRFYESAWVGKGRVSVLGLYEHGYSGSWHKVTADVTVAKGVAIGYHDQAFVGRGPRVSLTNGKMMVWAAACIKNGELHPILSIRVSN